MTAKRKNPLTIQRVLPYLLIIGGIIGLIASFVLTMDHINLYKNPAFNPDCNLNPIFSCSPVMKSWQATVFGFPNPLMGLGMFPAQILLGVVMLAGAKMKKWFWQLFGLSLAGGIGFTLWLIIESAFNIKALCIYCMMTWIVMFVSAWYVFQYMLAEKHIHFKSPKITSFLRRRHGDILLAWFIILTGLILYEFWYFFGPKLGF